MDEQEHGREPPAVSEAAYGAAYSVPAPMRPTVLLAGLVLLAIPAAASLMLAIQHMAGLNLPGCGHGSPCEQAAESVWGEVPYIEWPVSYVGLAYFVGLLLAWPGLRRGVPAAVRWLVRLGLLASLGFTLIMLLGGYLCPYCLVTHASNLVFWVVMEASAGAAGSGRRALAWIGTAFVGCSLIIGVADRRVRQAAQAVAETKLRQSGEAILAAATQGAAAPQTVGGPQAATTRTAETLPAPSATTGTAPAGPGFTGRHRLGPELAAIRIVLFMDYECKGCHLVELELRKIIQKYPDISISFKHWPGDPTCNPHSGREHANACRAARVAETAGILRGTDGFWQMHNWLFDHNGRFTDEELQAALPEFGYDVAEYERVMDGDEAREHIQGDIEEGFELGLDSTPMIFINGVEFTGWSAPLGLTRVVDKLVEADLARKSAEADRPLAAAEHFAAEWRGSRVRQLPPGGHLLMVGAPPPTLSVVVWGDYQQANTATVDGVVRDFIAERGEGQYTFRRYPLDMACNPDAKEERYPLGCRAARAAEAAAALGGEDGYWKMHAWLLANQTQFSDDRLRSLSAELGFDAAQLLAKMDDPAVSAAITADAQAAQQEGIHSIPFIFINGKVVPRWRLGEQPLLRSILEAATRVEPTPPGP